MEETLHSQTKEFPEGMQCLGKSEFQFECHPGVKCFMSCCRNVGIILYPYDIIRLKNALGMDSEAFVRNNIYIEKGDNPYFPTVKLKLVDNAEKSCPFLGKYGCTIYDDRPSACRMYPLEVAVDRERTGDIDGAYYFMTKHYYCLGHREKRRWIVAQWIRNQRLIDYNTMNGLWAEIDTIFSRNPWQGERVAGEKQQLAFMACYNIDGFRRFVDEHNLLMQFSLSKDLRRRISKEDGEMLKFAFTWLRLILTGNSSLVDR